MKHLPIRIMHMIKELHFRGYGLVYLYSGLSPSGMHWRYEIGQIENDLWPVSSPWIKGSVGATGTTLWCKDNSAVAQLVKDFEIYFANRLNFKLKSTAYSKWYTAILTSLNQDEYLEFYADYGGKHEGLLKQAPGYVK